MSVTEAKAELEIEPVTTTIGDGDDEILKGLRHPAAKIQFAEIEGRDELRRVIESGDFGAWRVFLHPQQRGMVNRTFNGPAKVTGGAGTGKTVVLLHRARHLLSSDAQARVVLTTYTKNLAEALAADLEKLDPSLLTASHLGARRSLRRRDRLAGVYRHQAGRRRHRGWTSVRCWVRGAWTCSSAAPRSRSGNRPSTVRARTFPTA